jgi:hypothetical protein
MLKNSGSHLRVFPKMILTPPVMSWPPGTKLNPPPQFGQTFYNICFEQVQANIALNEALDTPCPLILTD